MADFKDQGEFRYLIVLSFPMRYAARLQVEQFNHNLYQNAKGNIWASQWKNVLQPTGIQCIYKIFHRGKVVVALPPPLQVSGMGEGVASLSILRGWQYNFSNRRQILTEWVLMNFCPPPTLKELIIMQTQICHIIGQA